MSTRHLVETWSVIEHLDHAAAVMRGFAASALGDAIVDAGHSRRSVARDLGVSHVTVTEWCTGQRPVPEKHRDALVALLGGAS